MFASAVALACEQGEEKERGKGTSYMYKHNIRGSVHRLQVPQPKKLQETCSKCTMNNRRLRRRYRTKNGWILFRFFSLADLFLYSYESEFLDNMIRSGHRKLARSFNLCYGYIDDLIVFNNKKFGDYVKEIYPSQLTVEKANTPDDPFFLFFFFWGCGEKSGTKEPQTPHP